MRILQTSIALSVGIIFCAAAAAADEMDDLAAAIHYKPPTNFHQTLIADRSDPGDNPFSMTGPTLLQYSDKNDPYPYLAPEGGYLPTFETNVSSNAVPWESELRQNFYFKNSQGQYGRLFVDLSTDSTRPDTGITVEVSINPSGSRNLEADVTK